MHLSPWVLETSKSNWFLIVPTNVSFRSSMDISMSREGEEDRANDSIDNMNISEDEDGVDFSF